MKLIEKIILFLIALAIAHAVVTGLALLLAIALVAALIVRPRESLSFLAVFLLLGLIQTYPLAGLLILMVGGLCWVIGRRRSRRTPSPLLLPKPTERSPDR